MKCSNVVQEIKARGNIFAARAVVEASTAWRDASEGRESWKFGVTAFGLASRNNAITRTAVSWLALFLSLRSRLAVLFLKVLMLAATLEMNYATRGRLWQFVASTGGLVNKSSCFTHIVMSVLAVTTIAKPSSSRRQNPTKSEDTW